MTNKLMKDFFLLFEGSSSNDDGRKILIYKILFKK
jgi:hypothetical protein